MSLINKIKNFWTAFQFGLKGANEEIMGHGAEGGEGTEIAQETSDSRVAKHLLKGEVTQEVKELRYRTYKVSNASEGYDYLGDGLAVKKNDKVVHIPGHYKFIFNNHLLCEDVGTELNRVGDYGVERYATQITYDGFVRFKIEEFIDTIAVEINDDKDIRNTTLKFNKEPNPYNSKSMPFINTLKALCAIQNPAGYLRNEIATAMQTLGFTTYKTAGENNFTSYAFMNPTLVSATEDKDGFKLLFSWESYMRVPFDPEEKYYDKEMDEKYKTHAPKNPDIHMMDVKRKRFCSACGKEVSVYDGDIQEATNGVVLCKECLEKALKKEEEG